ncbi:unnamed protein product [Rhizophagus irregularis]|nr:unnamed protein product [Rhizophagus irregularis]
MGFLHTVRRNRLKNEKILAISQLQASINFLLREKELQDEDIEDNTIVTPEHWEQELREWEEMLIEEEVA